MPCTATPLNWWRNMLTVRRFSIRSDPKASNCRGCRRLFGLCSTIVSSRWIGHVTCTPALRRCGWWTSQISDRMNEFLSVGQSVVFARHRPAGISAVGEMFIAWIRRSSSGRHWKIPGVRRGIPPEWSQGIPIFVRRRDDSRDQSLDPPGSWLHVLWSVANWLRRPIDTLAGDPAAAGRSGDVRTADDESEADRQPHTNRQTCPTRSTWTGRSSFVRSGTNCRRFLFCTFNLQLLLSVSRASWVHRRVATSVRRMLPTLKWATS